MLTRPSVHGPSATVRQLRAFFADDHVHIALLVSDGVLVGAVERSDLAAGVDDRAPARTVARLDGRTITPETAVEDALTGMRRAGRRRLAVTTSRGELLGLLCLKAKGSGFCSDDDVAARRADASQRSNDPS
jgi:CBS domain-containing protein